MSSATTTPTLDVGLIVFTASTPFLTPLFCIPFIRHVLANGPFVEYVNVNGVQNNVLSLNVCKNYSVILLHLVYMEHMPLPGNNHYVYRIGI